VSPVGGTDALVGNSGVKDDAGEGTGSTCSRTPGQSDMEVVRTVGGGLDPDAIAVRLIE
jgi:hypothetical protein